MLAGHYAAAFGLRRQAPSVPLFVLFLAVQLPDILFFALVPLGIEIVRVDPSVRGPLAMELAWMPYTHSLALTALCAVLVAWAGAWWRALQAGVALGLAVLSHWLLDLIVHEPDLPLMPGLAVRVGWRLWRSPGLAWAIEISLLIGAALWLAGALRTRPARWWLSAITVLLVAFQTAYMLQPPPAAITELAARAELTYFAAALLARGVR